MTRTRNTNVLSESAYELNGHSFLVKYENDPYELSDFLKNHPGGVNYVNGYRGRDVKRRMLETHHTKSAFYLLREYKKGGRDKHFRESSQDLEYLVDWNKPMLSQVGKLGIKYKEWVESPVDRKLRLFSNPLLEILTITPWYAVPLIWTPILIYYAYFGYFDITISTDLKVPTALMATILMIALGVLLWSLTEYSLHRWIFHIVPSGSSKIMIYMHFSIHGLHHKVPFDTRRLVFPPVPAAIVAYVGHSIYSLILPECVLRAIVAGSIMGYILYDMIHYYLHSGSPREGSYLYHMKRYHNHHHFSNQDTGFGISNPGWDRCFGTLIKIKKLAIGIKWN